jgi:hypothetical protein
VRHNSLESPFHFESFFNHATIFACDNLLTISPLKNFLQVAASTSDHLEISAEEKGRLSSISLFSSLNLFDIAIKMIFYNNN